MKTELQIFENAEFGELRTVEENGKILFVASDVAKMLGYAKPANAIAAHCRYALKRGIPHPQGKGMLEVNIIPEGDVYRLIVHSKLPAAEKFESWVFDDVLPAIRRTGSYSANSADTLKAERLAIMKRNVRVREARLWEKLAHAANQKFNDFCLRNAALVLQGGRLQPPLRSLRLADKKPRTLTVPVQAKDLYSVTDLAEMFDTSCKHIATLVQDKGLNNKQYSCWKDESTPFSNKRIKTVRYNDKALTVLKNAMGVK